MPEEPRTFIPLPNKWSRRSFLECGACCVALELVGIPQPSSRGGQSSDQTMLSIREGADLVRRRAVSRVELTQACLKRIERLGPGLNAFITVTAERALSQAREADAEVRRGRWRGPLHGIPIGLKDTAGVRTTLASAVFREHAPHFEKTPELYDGAVRRNLRLGSEVTAAAYIESRRALDGVRRAIDAAFSGVDLLVTPTTAMPPPTIESAVRLGLEVELIRNTAPFNVYGIPTISIPCGFTRSGLPIGLQISGPRFAEPKVLALAHAYERATDWHVRRPSVD